MMAPMGYLMICILVFITNALCTHDVAGWDYVVIGAGPAGLQMGYFLQQTGRSYVILERANISGSFFSTYPRHDKLISINKRYTGKTNHEFNLRHDWNSLLSEDENMLFRHFSRDFLPHKDDMIRYLDTFTRRWQLNVKYNTEVLDIQKSAGSDTNTFRLVDQLGTVHNCRTLLLGTGLSVPNVPHISGIDVTEGYETISTKPGQYEGQTVLILGHGNAAFETADAIYGSANLVHVVGRSRIRLSWETHYVGDVRGVNNNLLDTYQLKSLDGVLEGDVKHLHFSKVKDKVKVALKDVAHTDNFSLRATYDRVIRCLGFKFDTSIFNSSINLEMGNAPVSKFPKLGVDYQSVGVPGMYVLGVAAHSLDYRLSAGGFIHGFRYTVRALHHILEWRQHGVPWPSHMRAMDNLLPFVVKRINEASGIYQMFGVLCDVIIIRDEGRAFEYIEEFPLALLPDLPSVIGRPAGPHIVISLEYGRNYSGPGKDVFHESRASGFAHQAHKSNFLHPVLYYYEEPITAEFFRSKPRDWVLPRPSRLHHVLEDFLTDWSRALTHILPLRRFLEYCVGNSLMNYFTEHCFANYLTFQNRPLHCSRYINGVSLSNNLINIKA